MIFTSSLSRIEKVFHDKYDLSSTIRHRGERGRQRENGLITFLKETLPSAYGVATGEIFPYRGSEVSPQCDVIIYDHLRMPILGRAEAVQQVPLEAVYCVIECKSVLDGAALRDAKQKFAKINSLPRCPSKTKIKKGMHRPPVYILFGYRLLASTQACLKLMQSSEHRDIGVVALNSGCGIWIDGRDKPTWLEGTSIKKNLYETLAFFYVSLLRGLQEVDLGKPDLVEMLLLN